MNTVTADRVVDDKGNAYVTAPDRGVCVGCAFRKEGVCARPTELYQYACVDTLRSDLKSIVWIKETN